MIRILFTFASLFYMNIAFAQQVEEIDQEWEDLSGAYAECAAYYRLVFFAL